MKITVLYLITFFYLGFGSLRAQEVDKVKFYKGYKHSLIQWEEVDVDNFLSWNVWKQDLKSKNENLFYREDLRDTQIHERMGYILGCVGDCRIYRGQKYSRTKYLSSVREGDEIETYKDSYLWVFLLDGTLVRLSPESSVSMTEFNIARDQNFFFVRMNFGNILWWNRTDHTLKVQDVKETDRLFLPVAVYDANFYEEKKMVTRKLFLSKNKKTMRQYELLNALISDNNKFVRKKTSSFIVLPNGSLYGSNFVAEFIVLRRDESFFKVRTPKQLSYLQEEGPGPINFFYRGYKNKKTETIIPGTWYSVSRNGLNLEQVENQQKFSMGEFPTQYVPTILTAREILLKKYSHFVFSNLGRQVMSEQYGYRLWDHGSRKGELAQRLSFLKDYTRRIETTNLRVVDVYLQRLKESGAELKIGQYGHQFYEKAMHAYFLAKEELPYVTEKGLILNSHKKKFWRVIHAKK